MRIAITRPVSSSFADCQLTYLDREPIDLALARRQHAGYESALQAAGCTLHRLEEEPSLPDAVFVEDVAIVLDEAAVVTRPGAESRRAEGAAVAAALARWRPVVRIEAPGTIDGGDVLRVGRRIWVGQSRRTNASGLEQLRAIAAPLGYRVEAVPVAGCLHLKSAVTAVAPTVLLVNPAWLANKWDPASAGFDAFDLIEVDPLEPHAANALLVGDRLVYPTAFPRTLARLRARGLDPLLVEVSEIAKAEGAVTCCSLIVEQGGL